MRYKKSKQFAAEGNGIQVPINLMLITNIIVLLLSACSSIAASGPTSPVAATSTSSPITPSSTTTPSGGVTNPNPIPLFAYYYIWFDASSWERAKKDYPILGPYSSDDIVIMRQHIQWAKAAGIQGFIVSWKSTDKLNNRLDQLIKVADEQNFKLAIIYQGLDFNRNPLPVAQVAADLDYFIDHYSKDTAFDKYEKPVVIWSGTWEFSRDEVAGVTQKRRDRLLILASEKNVGGFQRVADLVDGDAYYWSSVNPDTFPKYPEKLAAMGQAVHTQGGLWIAPAAPGFDAQLLNKKTIVDRKDGETLRKEMQAALQSSPDMIGLISWNEFSENSHIEPSGKYGHFYLDLLTNIKRAGIPILAGDFDSSDSGIDTVMNTGGQFAVGLIAAIIIVSGITLIRRH
ncbi:MAG: endo-1,3-alpha-glucanase family glycosylhydrolase [Chloroflexota bacterium]